MQKRSQDSYTAPPFRRQKEAPPILPKKRTLLTQLYDSTQLDTASSAVISQRDPSSTTTATYTEESQAKGTQDQEASTPPFFWPIFSYMYKGERKVTQKPILEWISQKGVLGPLMAFKSGQIDPPENHDELRSLITEFPSIMKIKGKIKVLTLQCASRGVYRKADTLRDRLISRWSFSIEELFSRCSPVPGTDDTMPHDDGAWQWKAAWSLLFTVLKDLEKDKKGYFARRLGGASLFELQRQPTPPPVRTFMGKPRDWSFPAPKVPVTDSATEVKDSGPQPEAGEEDVRVPGWKRSRRSKRAGKRSRKASRSPDDEGENEEVAAEHKALLASHQRRTERSLYDAEATDSGHESKKRRTAYGDETGR